MPYERHHFVYADFDAVYCPQYSFEARILDAWATFRQVWLDIPGMPIFSEAQPIIYTATYNTELRVVKGRCHLHCTAGAFDGAGAF